MSASKFSIAALVGCLASTVSASYRAPNQDLGDGTVRMHAEHVRSDKVGLADVYADTKFKLDDGNQSYLFMDTSALYETETDSYKQLKNRVAQHKKSQLMKYQAAQSSKFGGNKHRLGLNDKVPITYGIEKLYTGSIYIGESDSEMKVIYDTGSDWLLIEGRGCENCKGSKYDSNTSSYYTEVDIRTQSKVYGSFYHVEGKEVQDQVCLKSFSLCMDPLDFFLVSEQFGIPDEADGIMGLAQGRRPRDFNIPEDFEVGPLFLDTLSFAQHITEKAFSTRFTGSFGESFVDFGPMREEEMSSIGEVVEVPCNKGFFYSSIPQGVRFGPKEDGQVFALDRSEAIFTTGISLSLVPKALSNIFFQRLMVDVEEYYEENGVFYANCGSKMKDLDFMFEEHWIHIKGKDMLTDISEKFDNTLCIVNFLPSVDDFWVLGNTIFKDYYVYHNPEQGMMKWVPTNQRFKEPLEKGVPPSAEILYGYNYDMVYVKLAVALAMILATGGTAHFVFTTTFAGISFLNSSARPTNKHDQLAKKVDGMSVDSLKKLLTAVKERKSAQNTACIQ